MQACPECKSELHEEVTQMPKVSTPFEMPSAAKYPLISSWVGDPYVQLIQEEKTRAWFTEHFALYSCTTQKWTAAALQFLSGTTLNYICEGKSLHWAKLQAVNMTLPFVWKEKWSDVIVH